MAALGNIFRVAIFDEFLDAFARIPRAQQKKVNKFVRKFREDPTQASINFESIKSFVDPNLRTVRIDEAYRAIVLKPDTGNVYVLLWVDHHDDAMRWAEKKRVLIHPETGSLQVLAAEPPAAIVSPKADAEEPPLLGRVRDRELIRLGVPEEHLPALRAVRSIAHLDALRPSLPPEAYEAVYWLSEGESLEEVEKAMAVAPPPTVDTADFGAALDRDVSRRRFVVVDNDAALEAMLDAPLEKWRTFLHPSQRELIARSWNGPVRVLGGAGTGKTVVAMHRANYLAEKVFTQPDDRILFTTFTRNLAADIGGHLTSMCSPDARRRIEVVHLDGWVRDVLRRAGYGYEIAWWGMGDRLDDLWNQALTLRKGDEVPAWFYRDEWELVVQPHGCETLDAYIAAPRTGRGIRLSRAQRKDVWVVFEEYRNLLEKRLLREPEDALRDAKALIEKGKVRVSYRSVVVDEAQDMSTAAFALLRQIVPAGHPDDLFIVGDGHQRIYRKRVVLSQAGVNVRGRGRRLRINYRTTDEIRRYAVALLEGVEVDDLDAAVDTQRGYKSLMHGEAPDVKVLGSFEMEVDAIRRWLGDEDLSRTCLVARTQASADRYAQALQGHGVVVHAVPIDRPDSGKEQGLRVATMHRVKGLEYDRVVLAGVTPDAVPLKARLAQSADGAVRREAENMERAILYVAMTRARRAVLITAQGKASEWVKPTSK